MNKTQRLIVAIAAPVMLLIACLAIAPSADTSMSFKNVSAFDFEDTWWVWLITIALIGYIEFKLWNK